MLTTTGAALDPLSVGLTGWLAVEEYQEADVLPFGLHLAQDAVTAHAAQHDALASSCTLFALLQKEPPSPRASEGSAMSKPGTCAR